jgi:Flp pilus assembly pilin Flp
MKATMTKFQQKFNALVYGGTRGATMVEYALLLFLILVVAYLAFKSLGSSVSAATQSANQKFQ